MSKSPVLYTDDEEIILPFKYEICSQCRGHGTSSAYLGAFTGDQMREDPEFAADYADGLYDRSCEPCDGSGKVKVVDKSKMTRAQVKAYREQRQDEADVRTIERMERMMEGGWRDMEAYGNN